MLGLGKTRTAGGPAVASQARREERVALGLVLCGGLGYVEASTVLRIGRHDMADLLRTVMRKLAISPAAMAGDGDQV
jgi:thermostable 8-oxoguanine DNA glycosylase